MQSRFTNKVSKKGKGKSTGFFGKLDNNEVVAKELNEKYSGEHILEFIGSHLFDGYWDLSVVTPKIELIEDSNKQYLVSHIIDGFQSYVDVKNKMTKSKAKKSKNIKVDHIENFQDPFILSLIYGNDDCGPENLGTDAKGKAVVIDGGRFGFTKFEDAKSFISKIQNCYSAFFSSITDIESISYKLILTALNKIENKPYLNAALINSKIDAAIEKLKVFIGENNLKDITFKFEDFNLNTNNLDNTHLKKNFETFDALSAYLKNRINHNISLISLLKEVVQIRAQQENSSYNYSDLLQSSPVKPTFAYSTTQTTPVKSAFTHSITQTTPIKTNHDFTPKSLSEMILATPSPMFIDTPNSTLSSSSSSEEKTPFTLRAINSETPSSPQSLKRPINFYDDQASANINSSPTKKQKRSGISKFNLEQSNDDNQENYSLNKPKNTFVDRLNLTENVNQSFVERITNANASKKVSKILF